MANARLKKVAYKKLASAMARRRDSEWERMDLFKQIVLQLCDKYPSIACEILEGLKKCQR